MIKIGGKEGASSILLTLALGCGGDVKLVLTRPWGEQELGVVSVTTPSGSTLHAAPFLVLPTEKLELSLTADEPFTLVAESFPADSFAPSGEPLADCGVSFSGDGVALPTPAHRYRAGPFQPDSELFDQFVEQDAQAERDVVLRHERCNEIPTDCRGVRFTLFDLPILAEIRAIAAIDDGAALFGGTDRVEGQSMVPPLFGTIAAGRVTFLPTIVALRDSPASLVWDGTAVWGIGGRRITGSLSDVFRLDFAGNLLPAVALRLPGPTHEISAGDDGSVFFSSIERGLFESITATIAAARDDCPEYPRRLFAVSKSRILIVGSSIERPIYVYDGSRWSKERQRDLLDPRDINSLSGDDQLLAAGGSLGMVLARSEASHVWTELPPPPGLQNDVGGLAVLQGSRLVVIGSHASTIAVWQSGAWCSAALPAQDYTAISAAPSGRVAWATGHTSPTDSTRHSVVVKIELTTP